MQRQFDEEGNNIVVNSIHPGTTHSKIQQQSVIPLEVRIIYDQNKKTFHYHKGSISDIISFTNKK